MFKKFTLRLEEDMLEKLHYVAQYDDRTAASLTRTLIRDCIKNFEKEHGEIGLGNKQAPSK